MGVGLVLHLLRIGLGGRCRDLLSGHLGQHCKRFEPATSKGAYITSHTQWYQLPPCQVPLLTDGRAHELDVLLDFLEVALQLDILGGVEAAA